MLKWIVLGLVLVTAGLMAWVRLAPTDAARWHVDPAAAMPEMGRFVLRPRGGDMDSPVLPLSPAAALAALDQVARAWPRTQVVAGSVAEGRITYVTRSALMGYPDFTTVTALPAEGGAQFAILARQRFGLKDFGVNETRVRAWLAALAP